MTLSHDMPPLSDSPAETIISQRTPPKPIQRAMTGAFVGLAIAVGSGFAVWFVQKPTYTATSVMRLSSSDNTLLFPIPDGVSHRPDAFDLYRRTQRQMVKSRFVNTAALRDETLIKLPPLADQADPAKWLGDQLNVTFPENAELMEVSLSAREPEGLDQLVNAVIRVYFEEVVYEERQRKAERLNNLELARNKFETRLRSRLTERKQLEERLGGIGPKSTDLEMMEMDIAALKDVVQRLAGEIERSKVELAPEGAHNASRVTLLTIASPPLEADPSWRVPISIGAGLLTLLLEMVLFVCMRSLAGLFR